MPFLLIRHKVKDFASWKPVFDAHRPARQAAGLEDLQVLRDADDPANVVLLFRAADLERARAFAASTDLREAMTKAGVTDKPDVYFLNE